MRTTLKTFLDGPQGTGASGTIGYKGWFYHFLDMQTGLRYMPFNSELSSIDTALLLAGVLYARQYFDRANAEETEIRAMADAIFNRVDWNWMAAADRRAFDGLAAGVGLPAGELDRLQRGHDPLPAGAGRGHQSVAGFGLEPVDERLHLGNLLRPVVCALSRRCSGTSIPIAGSTSATSRTTT